MAVHTYKGTKITGMKTSGQIFKKSGVKDAKKKDLYFNTSTGHVYKCTVKGGPKKAKWKYIRTDIVKKPTVCVSSLGSPTRTSGTHKMASSWKTPDAMVDQNRGDRTTDLDIYWSLGIKGTDPKKVYHTTNEKATSSSVDLNNVRIGGKTYTRASFYPFKNKPILSYVGVRVVSRNSKGQGKSASAVRNFDFPRPPTISAFSFNEVGELSCTITTDAGNDYKERYDTRYKMTVYYSNTKKTSTVYPNKYDSGVTTSTTKTLVFDDANYASRRVGDYALVTVEAWARGYRGDSKHTFRTIYISYPAKAEITGVSISDKTSSGKATIYISTNSNKEHPVDRVKLEVLANSEYGTASQIPASAGWESTNAIDNAQCNAMSISVSDLIPERGRFTWLRLKTYHLSETVLYIYSNYFRVKDLETPAATALDDKIKILSAVAGMDGSSAVVDLVWNDGEPRSTGTELSWDTEEDAWKSTKDPSTYEFVWSDGPKTIDNEEWQGSAKITIKDLGEGEKYYIKARRYNEGDETTYSEYSNVATVITSEKPESVGAVVDRYVPKGSGLNIYWTFSGNGLQQEWQIVKGEETVILSGSGSISSTQIPADRLESLAEDGNLTFTVQVSTGSGWVSSEEKTVTIIDPPTLSITAPTTMTQQPYEFTALSSVPSDLIVIVTSQGAVGQFPQGVARQTAGDTIHSDVYKPDWSAGYTLTQDTSYLDKRYFVKNGDTYELITPPSDEGVVDPDLNPSSEGWYEEIVGMSTQITLPTGLDFWDLGTYTISVVAIDRQTNLRSSERVSNFSVAWSHQAPSIEPVETYSLSEDTEVSDDKNYYVYDSTTQTYTIVTTEEGTENPSEEGWYEVTITRYVTLTPIDTIDENGYHHQAVEIDLTPPPNAEVSDVYDIYRVTGDGARLIGQSFPQTFTTTDEYAPFSEDGTNYYRIAVRTADGDISFSDIEYVLEGDGIRVDWEGGSVEYPYNIEISDSYKKDVDIRKHLDGSISGYWNEGVEREGSLSTNAIKIIQQSDIDLTRQLGRYTGPVFIRTREGTAFEADAQISDLSTVNTAVMSIAIDATEIDLTNEFMLPVPFRIEEGD